MWKGFCDVFFFLVFWGCVKHVEQKRKSNTGLWKKTNKGEKSAGKNHCFRVFIQQKKKEQVDSKIRQQKKSFWKLKKHQQNSNFIEAGEKKKRKGSAHADNELKHLAPTKKALQKRKKEKQQQWKSDRDRKQNPKGSTKKNVVVNPSNKSEWVPCFLLHLLNTKWRLCFTVCVFFKSINYASRIVKKEQLIKMKVK